MDAIGDSKGRQQDVAAHAWDSDGGAWRHVIGSHRCCQHRQGAAADPAAATWWRMHAGSSKSTVKQGSRTAGSRKMCSSSQEVPAPNAMPSSMPTTASRQNCATAWGFAAHCRQVQVQQGVIGTQDLWRQGGAACAPMAVCSSLHTRPHLPARGHCMQQSPLSHPADRHSLALDDALKEQKDDKR